MNLLLVDIGNTRIKWRLLQRADGHETAGAVAPQRIVADGALPSAEADHLAAAWRGIVVRPAAAYVSNVASVSREAAVEAAVGAAWPGVPFTPVRAVASQCGVENGYREPSQLGADRWLALIAAHALAPDRSALVCSFGTATTIDLLKTADGRSRFAGGLILPGLDTMRRSLSTSTARLPPGAGRVVDFADRTDDAIDSGVAAAQVGAVERAWRDATARATVDSGGRPPGTCFVAGGAADAIVARLDPALPVRVVHDLVLRGLALVAFATLAGADRTPDRPAATPLP